MNRREGTTDGMDEPNSRSGRSNRGGGSGDDGRWSWSRPGVEETALKHWVIVGERADGTRRVSTVEDLLPHDMELVMTSPHYVRKRFPVSSLFRDSFRLVDGCVGLCRCMRGVGWGGPAPAARRDGASDRNLVCSVAEGGCGNTAPDWHCGCRMGKDRRIYQPEWCERSRGGCGNRDAAKRCGCWTDPGTGLIYKEGLPELCSRRLGGCGNRNLLSVCDCRKDSDDGSICPGEVSDGAQEEQMEGGEAYEGEASASRDDRLADEDHESKSFRYVYDDGDGREGPV